MVERGRCGHGEQQGKCRKCREERADSNTAGQQADDAVEQGEARGVGKGGGEEGRGERTAEGGA